VTQSKRCSKVLSALIFIAHVYADELATFVSNYKISEAKFTTHNTTATLLQNVSRQIDTITT